MTSQDKQVFYEEILSWYLRVLYDETLSRYLRVVYEEHLLRYLRGNVATFLRGIFTWSLQRNVVLRFYDVIFSSLSYDELARNMRYDEQVTTKRISSLIPRKGSFTLNS